MYQLCSRKISNHYHIISEGTVSRMTVLPVDAEVIKMNENECKAFSDNSGLTWKGTRTANIHYDCNTLWCNPVSSNGIDCVVEDFKDVYFVVPGTLDDNKCLLSCADWIRYTASENLNGIQKILTLPTKCNDIPSYKNCRGEELSYAPAGSSYPRVCGISNNYFQKVNSANTGCQTVSFRYQLEMPNTEAYVGHEEPMGWKASANDCFSACINGNVRVRITDGIISVWVDRNPT